MANIKTFTFADIKQKWAINCPDGIPLEFFMENYCKKFLDKHSEVHVVADKFTFVFR